VTGTVGIERWPASGPLALGTLAATVPNVDRPADAWLRLSAIGADGTERARNQLRLAVMPALAPPDEPLEIGVHDPLEIWGIGRRIESLGHYAVDAGASDLVVASELTPELVARVEAGARALILVRSRSAIPDSLDLRRRVSVHLRQLTHAGWPGQVNPWEGDWVSNFSWILPGAFDGLPERAPLDFAFQRVAPDHVLLGHDPVAHRDEVLSGMFVGWVHDPAALAWEFTQGSGRILLTTFRLAPEGGPMASALLAAMLRRLAEAQSEDRARRRYSASA
jgi:hypothetical protein